MPKTVLIIVLDSLGVGALPDAGDYGDAGSNTLKHVLDANPQLALPNLARLGMGKILPHAGFPARDKTQASFGRAMTRSKGKDTITGHWEMAGLVMDEPFVTFPHGFPDQVVAELSRRTGRNFLGNVVASGTEIITQLGQLHVETGSPILYTSADSVMQIAAHEEIIPLMELYSICGVARDLMQGEMRVARIIARPFSGVGTFFRTVNRHDYAVAPPTATLLDVLEQEGLNVTGIGKICDIYNGRGFSACLKTDNNKQGMDKITTEYSKQENGLIFANLVDFDMLYGHRNDAVGYGHALAEFDHWLGGFLPLMRPLDHLFIVADHGCDPLHPGTDHTREFVPLLVYSPSALSNYSLGDRHTLADVAATVADLFELPERFAGSSFKELLGLR
ncbi:MAG: Phosphopentomutase [Firmicutes bacterium]|nr:Phosphopentomutase [Bacillota bacterium]